MAAGAETELERLVVRLLGDQTDFLKMLQDSQKETKKFGMDMAALSKAATDPMIEALSKVGRAAMEQAEQQAAAAKKHQETMARGEEVTKSVMTEQEKYAETVKELDELLKAGAISQETYNRAIGQASPGLSRLQQTAIGAMSALGAGSLLKEALGNFQEAEDIGLRLNAVLETNGREVGELTERYDAFAKALEKTTTMEDDAVMAMLATAESFDLTASKAEEAVQNAIAIAAVNGGVAESYMRITAAMAEGDMEKAMGMGRLVPQLRGVKNEAEFAAKFLKLTASGMKAAEAAAKSSGGQFKTLKRDFGNMLEELGGFVARVANPVVIALKSLVEWFRGLDEGAKIATTAVLGLAAGLGTLTTAFGFAALTNPLTWLAAAAGAAVFFTAKIVGSTDAVKDLNNWLKQAREQSELVKKSFAENPLQVKAKIEGLPGAERKDALAKELQIAEAMVEIHKRTAERIRQDRDEALTDNPGDRMGNAGKILRRALGEWHPVMEVIETALKNSNEELVAAKANALAVRRQFEALAGGGMTEQVRKDVKKLNEELEKTIRQSGLGDLEKKLDDLRQKGATGPEVARTEALIQMARDADALKKATEEAAEAARKLNDEAVDMANALEADIATFGMSAEAAKLFKLEMMGLDEATAGHIRGLMEEKERLDEWNKVMERGKQITQESMSAGDKYWSALFELEDLLEAGAISWETYEAAIDKADEAFAQAGKDAAKAHKEIAKFDSALSGSAEALQRIEAFRDKIGLPTIKGTDGAAASAVVQQANIVPKLPDLGKVDDLPDILGAAGNVAEEFAEGLKANKLDAIRDQWLMAGWDGGFRNNPFDESGKPGNFGSDPLDPADPNRPRTRIPVGTAPADSDLGNDEMLAALKDINKTLLAQSKNTFQLEPIGLED